MIEMRAGAIRRRDLIAGVCGAAAVWPLVARAQQPDRVRRLGVLMNIGADDLDAAARLTVLRQALAGLDWIEGRNIRIDIRWGSGDIRLYRQHAAELVALAPDVILATAGPIVAALQQESRTLPIVFTTTIDPLGLGYVTSLARPGGNVTGVAYVPEGFSEKYLQLLKDIAPTVTRVGVLRDSSVRAGNSQFEAAQVGAPRVGVALTSIDVRNGPERENAVATLARDGNGGLVVMASVFGTIHRKEIVELAAKYRLPAVYPNRFYVHSGGLLSYGPAFFDQYRRAVGYVDRILKGAKPGDLPVQTPTTYETVLNVSTATALGLVVPRVVFAGIDEFVD